MGLAGALALAACTSLAPVAPLAPVATPEVQQLLTLLPADALLLGEQHDAPDHQRLQREVVQALAARGQLAALVMEMAERGHSTAQLPRDASEAQAQAALQWSDGAWPWAAYGPTVMAAVRAGVPVLGGNLPRADMRAAMVRTGWDQHLPAAALQSQYEA
ncbi:MAG: ChaN family lipoprotein, partial [Burkholderiaceae bacterium]|nr:ChaN family lipoprotein [Burkholderiaceae bacterium]